MTEMRATFRITDIYATEKNANHIIHTKNRLDNARPHLQLFSMLTFNLDLSHTQQFNRVTYIYCWATTLGVELLSLNSYQLHNNISKLKKRELSQHHL